MDIPEFKTQKETIDFLVENNDILIAKKKSSIKHADAIAINSAFYNEKGETIKANIPVNEITDTLKVRVVINTTNLMDSHDDVHMPGIWTKTLKENRKVMHLQEHDMSYKSVISSHNDLHAYAKTISWDKLGYDFEGKTQALMFDSTVKQSRNSFMFDQYKQGYVDNHSVGMQYVKIQLAVNDKDHKQEYETWNKYFPEIVNQSQAKSKGYFFAVQEAKLIEGSAVLLGSNYATPTLENNMKGEPDEPTHTKETVKEPLDIKNSLKHYNI